MNHPTEQIANALAHKQDIKEIVRLQLKQAVNHLLELEFIVHLGYKIRTYWIQ